MMVRNGKWHSLPDVVPGSAMPIHISVGIAAISAEDVGDWQSVGRLGPDPATSCSKIMGMLTRFMNIAGNIGFPGDDVVLYDVV